MKSLPILGSLFLYLTVQNELFKNNLIPVLAHNDGWALGRMVLMPLVALFRRAAETGLAGVM